MLAATAIRPQPIAASLSRARCKMVARPGLFTPDSFQGSLLRRVPGSTALSKGVSHQHKRCILASITNALSDAAAQYPLHAAVRTARTSEEAEKTIKQLLAAGHSVNQPDDKGSYPLHFAAINPNLEAGAASIRLLVAAGADVAAKDARGSQALHWGLGRSRFASAMFAFARSTSGKPAEDVHDEALHVGSPVIALLEAGADVAAFDADGWQPLHLAAFQSTTAAEAEAVITLLLDAGADVFATRDNVTEQAIHLVVQNPSLGAASAAIRRLCVAGASPDASAGNYDMRPLHLVVRNRDSSAAAAAVKALLEAGADVNAYACNGLTPLHAAAGCECANVINTVVPLLLGAGADVNERDVRDMTALHHAVLNEDPDAARMAVKVLVAAGADINAEAEDGKQPLHAAAECSHLAIVLGLVAQGPYVDGRCQNGQTPLHCAVKSNSGDSAADCITVLVAAGADVHALDDNNTYALAVH